MKVVISIFTLNLIVFVQCLEINRAIGEKAITKLRADEESERIRVCIYDDDLGCFPETEPGKKTSTEAWRYPQSVGTEFRFWAREGKRANVLTSRNIQNIQTFNPNLKTFFIIHGFQDRGNPWMTSMKNALLNMEDSNVFLVNWSSGITYGTARANIWVVGAEVGRVVQQLGNIFGMHPNKVHIIGHSLGAHAAGFAGKWIKDRMGGTKVKRITGLDPAGPDFENVVANERLDRNDAEFVDIIHSNFADSLINGFGLEKAIGHFDFYPNGGEQQPGCPTVVQGGLGLASKMLESSNPYQTAFNFIFGEKKTVADNYEDVKCNHVRSILFFIDSINNSDCNFKSKECGSWEDYQNEKCSENLEVFMGYRAYESKDKIKDSNASKTFYLSTNAKSPFCKP